MGPFKIIVLIAVIVLMLAAATWLFGIYLPCSQNEYGARVGTFSCTCPSESEWVFGSGCKSLGGEVALEHSTVEPYTLVADISGCAASEDRSTGTRSKLAEESLDGPYIFFGEDNIIYRQIIDHACCLEHEMTLERDGAHITLTNHWIGQPCKCMCATHVEATIANLPHGVEHTVDVYTKEDFNDGEPILVTSGAQEILPDNIIH